MLIIKETEYDLGQVKMGNVYEKLIGITNPTQQQVTVGNIGSSCSCTTGALEINPIPPGSSTNAKINFNSNKVGRGHHSKSYTISWTLNGKRYTHTIRFKVHVT